MARFAHFNVEVQPRRSKLDAELRRRDHVSFGRNHFREEIQSISIGRGSPLHAERFIAQDYLGANYWRILFINCVPGDECPVLSQAGRCREQYATHNYCGAFHSGSPINFALNHAATRASLAL